MGLQSALSTALTGMTAAETSIDVIGNNVANANTVGFKESKVNFATQFLQTQSIGAAPTGNRGGTNPRQVGLGVKVAEISPEFTQGTIEISSNPLDLAIQGDGFFIVQGAQGETLYTRNGQFKTNANNEIVTVTGQRALGFAVDDNFQLQPTGLSTIQIPIGAAAVAQATENVFMEGFLNPREAELGTLPEIIQSGILSDGSVEFPTGTATPAPLTRPADSMGVAAGAAGAVFGAGTYSYRITYLDANGNEGPASKIVPGLQVLDPPGAASLSLTAIPQPADPAEFTQIRIYRSNATSGTPANQDYRLVTTLAAGTLSHPDTATDASIAGNAALNDVNLNNNSYSYYVTFYDSASATESRPTARIGPVTANENTTPRIRLDNIPQPDPAGIFDSIRVYRNTASNSNSFFYVDDVALGVAFIDSTPDSVIATNPTVNLDGPEILPGMALVDVVRRDDATYTNPFVEGELSFAGNKGDRDLSTRALTITATTTVQDLLNFMEESMGIVKDAVETTFPGGLNYTGTNNITYGGEIEESRLKFTSNLGIENALSIDLSAFRMTPTGGSAETIGLPFASVQEANGEGASADFIVYDSLGSPLSVRVTTVLEDVSSSGARFRWIATSGDHSPDVGVGTLVGTGVITTDGDGKFISNTNDTIGLDRGNSPAASPLEIALNFSQVTGLDQNDSKLSAGGQDGFPAGTLTSFIISDTGRIQGVFSNGSSRDLGQLRMATFANPGGLQQVGDNLFATGVNSGLPIQGDPGSQGIGAITAGAVELSNSDIGQNLIELILASTQYRGGARVITAVQQLLDELLALRR